MEKRTRFAKWVLERVTQDLREREETSGAVSRLGFGAAFESWLEFEARLSIEKDLVGLRQAVGLPPDADVWTANEYPSKVDLSVGVVGQDEPIAAIEFKLVHNNKNWTKKCDEIWSDLVPTRGPKARMQPSLGRFALVGTVWKQYIPPHAFYPGQVGTDPAVWRREVDDYLLPKSGWGGRWIDRLTPATSFLFAGSHSGMLRGVSHGLELSMLATR